MAQFKDYRAIELAPKRSTGTGRKYARGFQLAALIAVEFEVEAVGATPTVTFTIQGLLPGGDETDANDWVDLMYVEADASVAASKAGITKTAVSQTVRFLDGLDKRFFEYIAVNVSANTNVTYSARAYVV